MNNVYTVRDINKYSSIIDSLNDSDFNYKIKIIEKSVIEANKYISENLVIPIANKVFKYEALLVVEEIPQAICSFYINYDQVIGIENEKIDGDLYKLLCEKYNYKVVKNEEEISIVYASEREKKYLDNEDILEVILTTGWSYKNDVDVLTFFQIVSLPGFLRYKSVVKL